MRRTALGLAAATVAALGLGTVVSAGIAPPVSLVLDTNTPDAGGPYVATYVNCDIGETIVFAQPESTPDVQDAVCEGDEQQLGVQGLRAPQQTPAPGRGLATVTFNAPTEPGTYDVTGNGESYGLVTGQIVVSQASTLPPSTTAPPEASTSVAPASGALPETGPSQAVPTAAIAIALLVVGGGLVILASRRRHSTDAS